MTTASGGALTAVRPPGGSVLAGVTRRPGTVVNVYLDAGGQVSRYEVLMDGDTGLVIAVPPDQVVGANTADVDHPDHGYGRHQRKVVDHDCPFCGTGPCGPHLVAVCAEDDEDWPCPVVMAYRDGRRSAIGPWWSYVTGVDRSNPDGAITGQVISVEGNRWEVQTDDGLCRWFNPDHLTTMDPASSCAGGSRCTSGYKRTLRSAIEQAELAVDMRTETVDRFAKGYAMGLRVAAGLLGMLEGLDPFTRSWRWMHRG
jgi:hypothetical protein